MFAVTSRYSGLPVAAYQSGDGGAPIRYVTRRFLPAVETLTVIAREVVGIDDRLDRIAARQFADPEAFWRIPDANPVLHPAELTATPGRMLDIALPAALVGSPRDF
jgi:hypothetical protein